MSRSHRRGPSGCGTTVETAYGCPRLERGPPPAVGSGATAEAVCRPNVETRERPSERMDVFVYGTLTEPERVAAVVDSFVFVGSATLDGLRLVEGRYPTLAPGGETRGRLLRTEAADALDAYEGVGDGPYVRERVPLDAPAEYPDTAAVYVGDPDRLDADATWPGEGSFADRVRSAVIDRDVRVRLAPADRV